MADQVRIPMAIDGGSKSAVAFATPGALKPRFLVYELPTHLGMGRFCRAMAEELEPFIREHGITDCAVEAPIIVPHKHTDAQPCPACGQYKRKINGFEVDKAFGVVHAVEMACDMAGIRAARRIARSTVVLHIAGTGRGTRKQFKTYCLLGCQRKGWNLTDEDCADAGATLDYFCHDEKIKVGWNTQPAPGPMFAGIPGVRIEPENNKFAQRVLRAAGSFDAGKG